MNDVELPNPTAAVAEVLSRCTCFNVRRASRIVTKHYDEALEPSGLRITQFGLLGALVGAGPTMLTDLAETLGMDRTTLTRNLKPLENQGLIEIDAGTDRRTHLVRLTERGRQAFFAASPLWKQAQSELVHSFGQGRTTALVTELRALVEQIQPT